MPTTPQSQVRVLVGPDGAETSVAPADSAWVLLLPAGLQLAPDVAVPQLAETAMAAGATAALLRPRGARGADALFAAEAAGDPRDLPVLDVAEAAVLVTADVFGEVSATQVRASYRALMTRCIFAAPRLIGIADAVEADATSPDLGTIAAEGVALADTLDSIEMTDAQRDRHLQAVLRRSIHDRVLVVATRTDAKATPPEIERVADVVRQRFAEATEDGLPPRVRVFIRLLRGGHYEAAWLVAQDNAIGVVPEGQRWSTSSGAARPQSALPLLTTCHNERAFAWLPGFRDPRYGAPESCYDISDKVRLRNHLDEVHLAGSQLQLSGWAYLTELSTSSTELVAVIATRGEPKETLVFDGVRVRRPDHVKGTGAELTRLAHAGWAVTVDLDALRRGAATSVWRLTLQVEQDGVRRSSTLGPTRGVLAETQLQAAPIRTRRWITEAALDDKERIVVRLQRWPNWRHVPAGLRRRLRRKSG